MWNTLLTRRSHSHRVHRAPPHPTQHTITHTRTITPTPPQIKTITPDRRIRSGDARRVAAAVVGHNCRHCHCRRPGAAAARRLPVLHADQCGHHGGPVSSHQALTLRAERRGENRQVSCDHVVFGGEKVKIAHRNSAQKRMLVLEIIPIGVIVF